MIGEALEITIVVSMLVLVGYPSTLMALEALRARCGRAAGAPGSRSDGPGVTSAAPTGAPAGAEPPPWREIGKVLLTLTTR